VKPDIQHIRALRWYLGLMHTMAAMLSVFFLGLDGNLFFMCAWLAILIVGLKPEWAISLAKVVTYLGVPLIIMFTVSDFIQSAGDILPPLVRLIVMLAVYRAWQMRSLREDLQLVVLSLFLVIITGVLYQEIGFALQLVLYTPLLLATLWVVNRCEWLEEAPATEVWKAFRWREFTSRLWEASNAKVVLMGAIVYLSTVAMASLLFITLPRFEFGQALPFLQLRSSGSLSGFSEEVRFGDIVNIIEDNRVALRVDTGREPLESRPYWRMVVLDEYTGRGFRASNSLVRDRREVRNHRFSSSSEPVMETGNTWTFYMQGGISPFLPLPGVFGELQFQNRQEIFFHESVQAISLKDPPSGVLVYRLENLEYPARPILSRKDVEWLRNPPASGDVFSDAEDDIEYPDSTLAPRLDRASRALLLEFIERHELTAAEIHRDTNAFSSTLNRALQDGRGYALRSQIPPGSGDTLLRWLNSSEPGHCELYAGAFILVARHLGYPARMAVGFVGGDWNGFENYYMIRNRDAHAWVEIFDREEGWIRIDPTPGSGPDGLGNMGEDGLGARIDRSLAAYLDSLRVMWYRRVIQFDQYQQQALVAGIREKFHNIGTMIREPIQALWQKTKAFVQRIAAGNPLLAILASLAAGWFLFRLWQLLAGGVSLNWSLHRSTREARIRRRAGRYLRLLQRKSADEPGNPQLLEDLQNIRFGKVCGWPPPVKVFKRFRKRKSR
jgi:hypothetical protein